MTQANQRIASAQGSQWAMLPNRCANSCLRCVKGMALLPLLLSFESAAQNFVHEDTHPKAMARASASLVSGESGGSIFRNPASLARRGQNWFFAGLAFDQDQATYQTPSQSFDIDSSLTIQTRPLLGVSIVRGDWVWSAVYLESLDNARVFPSLVPEPLNTLPFAPHRYAGYKRSLQERSLWLGTAWRINDWMSLGASFGAGHLSMGETRHVWGKDPAEGFNPESDSQFDVSMESSTAGVSLAASMGVLIAPYTIPFEFAFASSFRAPSSQSGTSRFDTLRHPSVLITPSAPKVSWRRPMEVAARFGARYLGQHIGVELLSECVIASNTNDLSLEFDELRWTEQNAPSTLVEAFPLTMQPSTYVAQAIALDRSLLDGQLILNAGYRYQHSFADPGNRYASNGGAHQHQLAAGFEVLFESTQIAFSFSQDFWAPLSTPKTHPSYATPFGQTPFVLPEENKTTAARRRVGVSIERSF